MYPKREKLVGRTHKYVHTNICFIITIVRYYLLSDTVLALSRWSFSAPTFLPVARSVRYTFFVVNFYKLSNPLTVK